MKEAVKFLKWIGENFIEQQRKYDAQFKGEPVTGKWHKIAGSPLPFSPYQTEEELYELFKKGTSLKP